MIKNRFVLIDAFALIHRAYHALPPFTASDGTQVGAVYGFASALLSAIKTLEPEYLAVGFDTPKPTKRHKEYLEYKAHRVKAPEELSLQIPYVVEMLQVMNIPMKAAEGYEGEDIIASIILNAKRSTLNANLEFIIVTGDLDCLQLVDKQTKVYSMARGVTQAAMYDIDKVKERYGLTPSQFVDFKALKGDPSDNIPGVPGIGEKGAANLIKEFDSLEELYQAINPKSEARNPKQIPNKKNNKKIQNKLNISEKLVKILLENKEQAEMSYKLSKIVTDAPVEFDLERAKIHDFDKERVIELFHKLRFKSLIPRLPESSRTNNNPPKLF